MILRRLDYQNCLGLTSEKQFQRRIHDISYTFTERKLVTMNSILRKASQGRNPIFKAFALEDPLNLKFHRAKKAFVPVSREFVNYVTIPPAGRTPDPEQRSRFGADNYAFNFYNRPPAMIANSMQRPHGIHECPGSLFRDSYPI